MLYAKIPIQLFYLKIAVGSAYNVFGTNYSRTSLRIPVSSSTLYVFFFPFLSVTMYSTHFLQARVGMDERTHIHIWTFFFTIPPLIDVQFVKQ
jgi:hypothetical protein